MFLFPRLGFSPNPFLHSQPKNVIRVCVISFWIPIGDCRYKHVCFHPELIFVLHSKFNWKYNKFRLCFQISTDHFFSIAKARQLLDYNPVPCGPEDWKVIKDSLRFLKNPQKSGGKIQLEGLLSKVVEFLRSLFSYTVFFFCTIYFYIIFFGSYITLGL